VPVQPTSSLWWSDAPGIKQKAANWPGHVYFHVGRELTRWQQIIIIIITLCTQNNGTRVTKEVLETHPSQSRLPCSEAVNNNLMPVFFPLSRDKNEKKRQTSEFKFQAIHIHTETLARKFVCLFRAHLLRWKNVKRTLTNFCQPFPNWLLYDVKQWVGQTWPFVFFQHLETIIKMVSVAFVV
jgi:hypothetical protein